MTKDQVFEGDDGDNGNEGEDELDDSDVQPPPQRRMPSRMCFARYVYARGVAARRNTAAYARIGKPSYTVVPLALLRNRAPLHKPFFATEDEDAAWDPEAANGRGFWLYNSDATQS